MSVERSGKSYAKELVFAVVLAIVTIKIQRAVSGPDFVKTVKMKGAMGVKKYASAQKEAWSKIEGFAGDFYDMQRM